MMTDDWEETRCDGKLVSSFVTLFRSFYRSASAESEQKCLIQDEEKLFEYLKSK